MNTEPKPAEYRVRVTEGSRMRAYQNNVFIMEFTAPGRQEPLKVELFESEQYEVVSPNPVLVEGLDKGPRTGLFILRPNNIGTITLNFRIGERPKTWYVSAQTENPYMFGEPVRDEHLSFLKGKPN